MAKRELPSPEALRNTLRYEPETGKLFRLEKQTATKGKSRMSGREVFTASNHAGHRWGGVCGVAGLLAHRVIWALVYGEWPSMGIDHANREPADNRLDNLRLATPAQNAINCHPRQGARYKGVRRIGMRWVARLSGKYIGSFDTEIEAARAYDAAAIKKFGSFACCNVSSEEHAG